MTPSTPKHSSRTVKCVTPEQITEFVKFPSSDGAEAPPELTLLPKKTTLRMSRHNEKDTCIQDSHTAFIEADSSTSNTFLEHKVSPSKVTRPHIVPPFLGSGTIEDVSELSLEPCPSALSYDTLSEESLQDILFGPPKRVNSATVGSCSAVETLFPGIVWHELEIELLSQPRHEKKPPPRVKEKPPDILDVASLQEHVDATTYGPSSEAETLVPREIKLPTNQISAKRPPPRAVEMEDKLRDTDIIFGKGGKANHHYGNKDLWLVVLEYRAEYQLLPRHETLEKQRIAKKIYNLMLHQGRRFVRVSVDDTVVVVPKQRSLEKIKQALRDDYVPLFAR